MFACCWFCGGFLALFVVSGCKLLLFICIACLLALVTKKLLLSSLHKLFLGSHKLVKHEWLYPVYLLQLHEICPQNCIV